MSETSAKKSLVKSDSEGYGYNYASLADIVKQGFEIPKMRLSRIDGEDFIEYYDGKEWQLGARIVVPDMKGSNDAQCYGSALTYARRYTALMALGLVCDDDTKIETTSKEQHDSNTNRKGKFDLHEADERIKKATTPEEVRKIYAEAPEKLRGYLEKGCKARIAELTK